MVLTASPMSENYEKRVVVVRHFFFKMSYIFLYKAKANCKDNGAKMMRIIQESGYESTPCFLHILQVVLSDCIFE
jgi:hypothetical protein